MPRVHFTQIKSLDINAVAKTVSVHGSNDKGQTVTAIMPIESLLRVVEEAKRAKLMAIRLSAGPLRTAGSVTEIVPIDTRTVDVARVEMHTESFVAIIFDRGFESEIAFRLSPEPARTLGRQLVAESEVCISAPRIPSN